MCIKAFAGICKFKKAIFFGIFLLFGWFSTILSSLIPVSVATSSVIIILRVFLVAMFFVCEWGMDKVTSRVLYLGTVDLANEGMHGGGDFVKFVVVW